jgi:hypothetical protein
VCFFVDVWASRDVEPPVAPPDCAAQLADIPSR